jgi:hypothetical protein
MKHLKLALGGAAAMSLLLVFFASRDAPKPASKFDDAFSETNPAILKKSDRIIPLSKPIVTERVIPDPPESVPPVVERPKPVPREDTEKRRRHVSNVCERHGMRKVTIGRRWRCRR